MRQFCTDIYYFWYVIVGVAHQGCYCQWRSWCNRNCWWYSCKYKSWTRAIETGCRNWKSHNCRVQNVRSYVHVHSQRLVQWWRYQLVYLQILAGLFTLNIKTREENIFKKIKYPVFVNIWIICWRTYLDPWLYLSSHVASQELLTDKYWSQVSGPGPSGQCHSVQVYTDRVQS